MTPYEMAAGSLFMAKEAGLQEILKSLGDATGADPTKLQDSLVGLLGGGGLGAGIGALTGGGKGALLGGSLGGVGGAAAGYAGSDYVRAMLEKLLGGAGGAEDAGPGFKDERQEQGVLGSRTEPKVEDINFPAPDMSGMSEPSLTGGGEPSQFDLGSMSPQFPNMDGSISGHGFEGGLSDPSFDLNALNALAAGGQ